MAANKDVGFGVRPEFTVRLCFDRKKMLSVSINKSQSPLELTLEGDSASGVQ